MSLFWIIEGHLDEGFERLGQLLGIIPESQLGLTRAKLLLATGRLAWARADYPSARPLFTESIALFRETGDKRGLVDALRGLGNVAYNNPDGIALYEESLALCRELGDMRGVASCLMNIGNRSLYTLRSAKSQLCLEEARTIFDQLGNQSGVAMATSNLGDLYLFQGNYSIARTYHEEAIEIHKKIGGRGASLLMKGLGDIALMEGNLEEAQNLYSQMLSDIRTSDNTFYYIAIAKLRLSEVALRLNNYPQAILLLEESLNLLMETHDPWDVAYGLRQLAFAALLAGEYSRSPTELLKQSMSIWRQINADPAEIALCLCAFGCVSSSLANHIRAAKLFASAYALLEAEELRPDPLENSKYEPYMAITRAQLDDAWEKAWKAGHSMTMEQAIAYALEETQEQATTEV